MISPPAVYAPAQDNASSLMQAMHQVSDVMKKSSVKGKQVLITPAQRAKLAATFKVAMHDLDVWQDDLVSQNTEFLLVELATLERLEADAAPVRKEGIAVITKARQRHSINVAALEEAHKSFMSFYKRVVELRDFAKKLATTPDPDESSPEFADFLQELGAMMA
jgi:hypothetical protein